jgi:hypothetical protein
MLLNVRHVERSHGKLSENVNKTFDIVRVWTLDARQHVTRLLFVVFKLASLNVRWICNVERSHVKLSENVSPTFAILRIWTLQTRWQYHVWFSTYSNMPNWTSAEYATSNVRTTNFQTTLIRHSFSHVFERWKHDDSVTFDLRRIPTYVTECQLNVRIRTFVCVTSSNISVTFNYQHLNTLHLQHSSYVGCTSIVLTFKILLWPTTLKRSRRMYVARCAVTLSERSPNGLNVVRHSGRSAHPPNVVPMFQMFLCYLG